MLDHTKTNDSNRDGFTTSEHDRHETMHLFDQLDPKVRWALNYSPVQWTVQNFFGVLWQAGVRTVRHQLAVIKHNDQLARDESPGHEEGWPGVRP